jgi:hypothetical protein
MSALPLKADIASLPGYVCFVPCVDGSELARLFSRLQVGRCSHVSGLLMRPRMAAGPNALRGSGPNPNLAFEDALILAGSPDPRNDHVCITSLCPRQFLVPPDARRYLIIPRLCGRMVNWAADEWERRGGYLTSYLAFLTYVQPAPYIASGFASLVFQQACVLHG